MINGTDIYAVDRGCKFGLLGVTYEGGWSFMLPRKGAYEIGFIMDNGSGMP